MNKKRELKLNWGIKNRGEQRELDNVIKNKDVRASQFRDLDKIKTQNLGKNVKDFNSVDEIYYYMEELFTAGFDEENISKALDVFLRDFGHFTDEDL